MPLYTPMGFRTAFVCLSLVACGVAEPELDEPENIARYNVCNDPAFCTTNSPVFNAYRTFGFLLDGSTNDHGFRFLGLTERRDPKNPNSREIYMMTVEDSHIIATDRNKKRITGRDLEGMDLWIELPDGTQGSITIARVGEYEEAVEFNKKRQPIESYVLRWSPNLKGSPTLPLLRWGVPIWEWPVPNLARQTYVCEDATLPPEEIGFPNLFESTVFEGDHFHADTKTVEQKPDDNWFNIGCGKHILAKLRLTRNTIKLVGTTPGGTWENEQAMLKLISADYCGTGQSFTQAGVPLVWRDQLLMTSYPPGVSIDLEARWSARGATCLGTPRLAAYADVEYACKLAGVPIDPCADMNPDSTPDPDELATSANY